MSEQKQVFLNEGLLKEPSLEWLRNRSLPTCKGHLILKSNGKFRLISIPTCFNARFRQAGGLVDFLRFLRDQVSFVFRPSLPNIPSAFVALSNLRALFPVGQRFYLARMDIADCFNSIDHGLLLDVFKKTAMLFSNTAFSDQFVVSELSFFLNNYVIKFAGCRLLQSRGIPQGSCVSTDLSNLFLAYIDRKSPMSACFWDAERKRPWGGERPEAGILRFHDDYLYLAASKGRLSAVRDALLGNLHRFGLRPNFSKENGGSGKGPASVEWLGLEITPHLDLLIPLVKCGPRMFDRFGGYPLPWKDCLFRLKACLHTSTHIKMVATQAGFASNSSVAEENARRIGLYFGHLVIVYIWSCPERHVYLASFKRSRQLAKVLICRLGSLLECTSLLSLARDALIQRLLQRRSEFRLLLRFFYEPRLLLPVIGKGTPQEKLVKNMSSYFGLF
ncbi:telomerase reverse transcriptase subunit [Echinococcus multilocularis]|uniref:Telomerase reverse transcriptase subunit n=1 Tax=Echinococcus multilocularis TaxID=6211 RepID=A0A068YK60_ECHMU|nr:telomerase reverse transcriptase subunit [Echinococcus multilocularis]